MGIILDEQLCEMVGKDGPNKSTDGNSTTSDAGVQRKSSIADWVSIRPRAVSEEEKQHWVRSFFHTVHLVLCNKLICDMLLAKFSCLL